MSLLRPILILIAFFGVLYYLREPLKKVAPTFESLHSAYSEPFKKLIYELVSATSSSVLGGSKNYIPTAAGETPSYSSGTSTPTNTNTIHAASSQAKVQGINTISPSTQGEILPVISNQQEGSLSARGITSYTNYERSKQGVPTLKTNTQLTASAEAKLQDMFQNQYFQHISPSGQSVSDVVTKIGYQYIVVGENLALGIFSSDEAVVAAWMASPGHKKNILDSRYQDIGIAVGNGIYQGRKQWLIVQHFGKPLSSCSVPHNAIKQNIEIEKTGVTTLEQKISALKPLIDQATGDEYKARATEYNGYVREYNIQLNQLKKDVEAYNEAVRAFNVCAGIIN